MQIYIDYITGRQYLFDIQTGDIIGTGTANQIAYFTGTKTISSLSTTIYPSLTELSYVKGVTSAIQTQINGKLSSISIGSINSQVKSANGLVVVGSSIVAQTADATSVGMVSTGAQTFAGAKTFSNDAFSSVVISSNAYTGNNGSHVIINPNITNNNAAGFVAIQTISGTISAGANNAIHYGLNLNTTFNAGAFTGTVFYDINFGRNNPTINLSSGSLYLYGNGTLRAQWYGNTNGFLFQKLKAGATSGTATNALDVVGDSQFGAATTPTTASARVQIIGASATTGSAFIVTNSTPTTIIRADNNQDLYLGSSGGKVGFYAVTPIVRPTTAIASAAYAAGGGAGSIIKTDDTIGGYTMGQVVQALKDLGLLT